MRKSTTNRINQLKHQMKSQGYKRKSRNICEVKLWGMRFMWAWKFCARAHFQHKRAIVGWLMEELAAKLNPWLLGFWWIIPQSIWTKLAMYILTTLGSSERDDNGDSKKKGKYDSGNTESPVVAAGSHPIIFIKGLLLGLTCRAISSCNTACVTGIMYKRRWLADGVGDLSMICTCKKRNIINILIAHHSMVPTPNYCFNVLQSCDDWNFYESVPIRMSALHTKFFNQNSLFTRMDTGL